MWCSLIGLMPSPLSRSSMVWPWMEDLCKWQWRVHGIQKAQDPTTSKALLFGSQMGSRGSRNSATSFTVTLGGSNKQQKKPKTLMVKQAAKKKAPKKEKPKRRHLSLRAQMILTWKWIRTSPIARLRPPRKIIGRELVVLFFFLIRIPYCGIFPVPYVYSFLINNALSFSSSPSPLPWARFWPYLKKMEDIERKLTRGHYSVRDL